MKFSDDDLIKSRESRHSCESRSPELHELTGFPLPAFAGTSFAGMTKNGAKGTFYESISDPFQNAKLMPKNDMFIVLGA
jgi:hypothetical protein